MKPRTPFLVIAFVVVALAAAVAGWRLDPRALLACYLAAWWFVAGGLLGGLANVWLHQLTGGAWGHVIRPPLLRAARWLPVLCLLFIPVLLGAPLLYPWMHGVTGEPDAAFRHLWLSPVFFYVRSVAYLLVFSALALVEVRALSRSTGRAAFSLVLYGFTVSLAAVDWIMSLQPEWYSSIYGWLAGAGQMLVGIALAILLIDRAAARERLPDYGNLLLMYVLLWAYMSYSQFLIIWSADLPHEIVWYVQRRSGGWKAVAWVLAATHFVAPLLILLSRRAKRAPRLLATLAGALMAAHLLDCWWQVLPSAAPLTANAVWLAPLVALGFGLLAWIALRAAPAATPDERQERKEEGMHA